MSRSHRLTRQLLAGSLVGCLVGCPLVSGVASGLDVWQRFRSERGNFSVQMPSPPEQQEKKRWFPIHSFVSSVYISLVGDDAFTKRLRTDGIAEGGGSGRFRPNCVKPVYVCERPLLDGQGHLVWSLV